MGQWIGWVNQIIYQSKPKTNSVTTCGYVDRVCFGPQVNWYKSVGSPWWTSQGESLLHQLVLLLLANDWSHHSGFGSSKHEKWFLGSSRQGKNKWLWYPAYSCGFIDIGFIHDTAHPKIHVNFMVFLLRELSNTALLNHFFDLKPLNL